MLVQKRRIQKQKIVLWGTVAIVVALAALLVYNNITTVKVPAEESSIPKIERLAVPKDLGQDLFTDPQFSLLSSEDQIQNQFDPYIDESEVTVLGASTLPSPQNIQVVNPGHGGRLTVSWAPVSDERVTGYTVWRSESGGSYKEVAQLSSAVTTYIDSDVVNEVLYSYRVTAVSQPDAAIQVSVTSDPISGGGNLLTVVFPENASAVQIFRTRNNETDLLVTLKTQTTQYIDREGQNGDTYRADISTSFIESEPSEIVTGIPMDVAAPDAPTDIKVVGGEDGSSVHIFWTNPLDPDFDYVRIYRSKVQGSLGSLVKNERTEKITRESVCVERTGQADETSPLETAEGDCFIDAVGIEEGTTYYYVLTSVDRDGNESSKRIIRAFGKDNPFSE